MSEDRYGEMKDKFMLSPIEDGYADWYTKAQTERERSGEDAPLFTPQTFGAPGPQGGLAGLVSGFFDLFGGE